MVSGEWGVGSGEWRVESGEWRVESGEWRVGLLSMFVILTKEGVIPNRKEGKKKSFEFRRTFYFFKEIS